MHPAGGGEVLGVVLLLHGGRAHDDRPVERKHASWWRMALLARSLARAVAPAGVPVELLRYRARGWNAEPAAESAIEPATEPAPVADARWALARLRDSYGDVPVVLVGHSMGGRAACALAGATGVAGVVGLAPWLPEGEPVAPAAGRRLVLAHGQRDRWTSAQGSLEWSRRARSAGALVARYELGAVGHFMASGRRQWNGLVRDASLGLLGLSALPPAMSDAFAGTGDEGLRLPPSW